MVTNANEITTQELVAVLERLSSAENITDVNIAAGIALNELRSTTSPAPTETIQESGAERPFLIPPAQGLLLHCLQKIARASRSWRAFSRGLVSLW